MGTFVPNTKAQQQEMLKEIGFEKLDDLFAHIPDDVKLQGELNLPDGMSEMEVTKYMKKMADENVIYDTIFRGAGAYKHYIPAIVGNVLSNETLQTAYTPYACRWPPSNPQSSTAAPPPRTPPAPAAPARPAPARSKTPAPPPATCR